MSKRYLKMIKWWKEINFTSNEKPILKNIRIKKGKEYKFFAFKIGVKYYLLKSFILMFLNCNSEPWPKNPI